MLKYIKNAGRKTRDLLFQVKPFVPPAGMVARMRSITDDAERRLEQSLRDNYFSYSDLFPDPPEEYLLTDVGRRDMGVHLKGRLRDFREKALPWIGSFVELAGANLLEVGCGTGSSTVALAEQGANVTAIELHDGSLKVARHRVAEYGLTAEFHCSNADKLIELLGQRKFDAIALFAVVEHMTVQERLKAIADCWSLLKPGGYLIVNETPNRLWIDDIHTAQEDFFMWLPDDLALLWSKRTHRSIFNRVLGPHDNLLLARWGRGVSYHDFALALDMKPSALPVSSVMELFFRQAKNAHRVGRRTWWRRYESLLVERAPDLSRGFCLPWIDIAFRKPS
jgi:2-polyprenyl-3-methyl-5-hydroxy-6-metoxy-1,4-benzoquinol methylase